MAAVASTRLSLRMECVRGGMPSLGGAGVRREVAVTPAHHPIAFKPMPGRARRGNPSRRHGQLAASAAKSAGKAAKWQKQTLMGLVGENKGFDLNEEETEQVMQLVEKLEEHNPTENSR